MYSIQTQHGYEQDDLNSSSGPRFPQFYFQVHPESSIGSNNDEYLYLHDSRSDFLSYFSFIAIKTETFIVYFISKGIHGVILQFGGFMTYSMNTRDILGIKTIYIFTDV